MHESHLLAASLDGTRLTVDLAPLLDLIRVLPSTQALVGGVVHADRIVEALETMRRFHRISSKTARAEFKRARAAARRMEIALAEVGLESDLLCDLVTARKGHPNADDLSGYTLADVHKVHPIRRRHSPPDHVVDNPADEGKRRSRSKKGHAHD